MALEIGVDEEAFKTLDTRSRKQYRLSYHQPSRTCRCPQDYLLIPMIQWLLSWLCKLWDYHRYPVCQHSMERSLLKVLISLEDKVLQVLQGQEGESGVGTTTRRVTARGEIPVPMSTELIV